jgi:hypothetical protein
MAGGVITAGLLGLGGSLLGAVGESQNQKQSFILQNAMANATIDENRKKQYQAAAEGIGSGVNQIFLAPEADITRQLAASKYKFGQGFDLEQAAESSAKARQATESMSPLQQSFANLLIQKNAEKERLGDSENNKLAAMFGPIGSGAALAGKYGLFGGGGAY